MPRLLPSSLPHVAVSREVTTFLLVRHAESEANAQGENERDTDSLLTTRGEQQAQRLARAFGDAPVGAIVSSDAQRARLTMAPLAAAHAMAVSVQPALREPRTNRRPASFVDAGQAAAMLEQLRAGQLPPPPPPAETPAEVTARLRGLLASLERPAGPIVICSHHVTLNTLVRLLIDPREPPAALWAHFDNGGVTRVDVPASRQPPTGILAYLNWVPPGG